MESIIYEKISLFVERFKTAALRRSIRVPKVPFRVFDKLKKSQKIQNFILRFCFYLNMRNEIQIFNYYFLV